MKRRHPESQLQRSVVQFIRTVAPKAMVFSVPNGGKRSRIEAAIMKAEGVLPGVADLLIFYRKQGDEFLNGFSHNRPQFAAIELKAGKNDLTDAQKLWKQQWIALGGQYVVARSLEDVERALLSWGVIDASKSIKEAIA